MKYAFIEDHRKEFNIALMCEVLKASRAGFYSWKNRVDGAKEKQKYDLQRQIEKIFLSSRNTYGSPRIFKILKGMGYNISKNTVARMMKEMDLSPNKKRRFKVKTTDSNHKEAIAPNLLKQNFNTSKRNEVWLSDLTYIATEQGWLYLVAVMELHTRKIIGWDLSISMDAIHTQRALEMAYKTQNPGSGVIFHSDRGIQYACKQFKAKLNSYGFNQSMSRKGNCYDNSPMESFFHTLKTEFVYRQTFTWIEKAKSEIFEWIECFYNRKRIHSSIGYRTPVEMEEATMLRAA